MSSTEKLPKPRPENKSRTSLGSTMRKTLGVGRPLFPRRSTSRKGSSASYNSHDTPIGSPSPSSPGTVNRRDLLLVQTAASVQDGSGAGSQHTITRDSVDRGADDTPMQHNPYFSSLTPRASSPPVKAAQTMQHLFLQNHLMNLFLQPACLALTQLAPQSILAQSQPPSIIGPGYAHNVPSTTSLATYLSSSEYAATSSSSHQPTNAPSTPFSQHTARSTGPSISMINGEQLAASALPMPTTSISALWRILCTLDWIQENSKLLDATLGQRTRQTRPGLSTNPSSADEIPQLPSGTFEIGAMLQGIADVLGSYAAHLGIELVLYHGDHPASESKRALQMENGIQELQCRGDEIGLGLAITAILSHIMAQTKPLATIEVGLQLTPPRDPLTRRRTNLSATSSLSEAESVRQPRNWFMALTITQTFSPAYPSTADGIVDTLAREPVLAALLQTFDLALSSGVAENSTRCTWSVTTRLTEATSPTSPESTSPPPPTPLSLPSRARSRADTSKDPALPELFKFADNLLKRKKAVLHSTESSVFAKHLTGYLTSWGMDVSHVASVPDDVVQEESDTSRSELSKSRSRNAEARNSIGRFDSGFGGSESQSPPSNTPDASNRPPSIAEGKVGSNQLDSSVSFIIIDDDISVLRRQLAVVKASQPGLHLNNTILHKRPGLGRRTRSTAQIRTLQPSSMVAIIHFTSSSNYRFIREVVQSIFKTASGNSFLPEVLVLPKPIGPRRLLTTMHTAVKRPVLDPCFTPIATSPSSAEGQFYFGNHSGRPSPAASLQQDFDSAFAEARHEQPNPPSSLMASLHAGPATPPITIQTSSNPSSPRATSAEAREYLEYMSKTTPDFSNTASAGILLQSPDGKPSGLFFQPVKRGPSSLSPRESRTGSTSSSRMIRDRLAPAELSAKPSEEEMGTQKIDIPAAAEHTPEDLQEGSPASNEGDGEPLVSSSSRPLSPGSHEHQFPISSPPAEGARAVPLNELSMHTDETNTSSAPAHPGFSRMPTASAALSSLSTITSPLAQSPPRLPASTPASAPVEHQSMVSPALQDTPGGSGDESPAPLSAPPAIQKRDRRSTSRSDVSKKTAKPRKPPVVAVPPINVLIVEDNPINQTILSTFMKRKGIRYAVAKDGQEAVDKWKAGAFHLVLMDIQLPIKDGITATMEIRAMEQANNIQGQITPTTEARAFDIPPSQRPSPVTSPSQLPVIIVALTASSLQADRLAALAAGCNDFITKPVSLQWLQQKLLEWGSMSILSSFKRLRQGSSSASLPSLGSSFLDRQSAQANASRVASRLHIDSKASRDQSPAPAAVTPPTNTVLPSVVDTPRTIDSLDDYRLSDDSTIPSATRDPGLAAEYDQSLSAAPVSSEARPGPSPIEVNAANPPESAEPP